MADSDQDQLTDDLQNWYNQANNWLWQQTGPIAGYGNPPPAQQTPYTGDPEADQAGASGYADVTTRTVTDPSNGSTWHQTIDGQGNIISEYQISGPTGNPPDSGRTPLTITGGGGGIT